MFTVKPSFWAPLTHIYINILSRKPISPQQRLQSLIKMFLLQWQRPAMHLYSPPQRDFFIVHLKIFQYETPARWVNTWLFYHAHSLAHGMLQWNILTYSKKKILTHLLGVWNCSNIFIPVLFPFTLTLLRMKNTITPLYCAAFIVDCFMSVRIHFLLNLSSFTQGHILLCISIPQLFKTRACLSLWLLTWPKMW